jgi:hypothetical protein
MRFLKWNFTIAALLVASVAHAADPHVPIIEAAKAAAIAAGVDVDRDECTRFEITKRAAVLLAGEGAGLLAKPSGNNCQGYAVDIIAFPAGRIFDVIGAGPDGPNTPQWIELTPVNPDRWRAPIDVVAPAPAPAPLPSTPIPPPMADHAQLDRMEAQLAQIRADIADLKTAEAEEHARTRADLKAFREAAKKATNKALELLPSIISGLSFLRK